MLPLFVLQVSCDRSIAHLAELKVRIPCALHGGGKEIKIKPFDRFRSAVSGVPNFIRISTPAPIYIYIHKTGGDKRLEDIARMDDRVSRGAVVRVLDPILRGPPQALRGPACAMIPSQSGHIRFRIGTWSSNYRGSTPRLYIGTWARG